LFEKIAEGNLDNVGNHLSTNLEELI
jgi:hypothetical protein